MKLHRKMRIVKFFLRLLWSFMSDLNASEVLKRIALVVRANQDYELAKFLEVAPQTIATWKKRNKIPFEHVVDVAMFYEISTDYLLFGEDGPKSKNSLGNQIDERLMNQVVGRFKKEFPQYFKSPATTASLKVIHMIYNNVCNMDDSDERFESIQKFVDVYKAGLQIFDKENTDTTVTQHITGTNHQVAGRDIVKKG